MTDLNNCEQGRPATAGTGRQMQIADIYKRYFGDVQRFFQSYTHDVMRAEDMTQELFIKLMGYENMIVEETAHSFVFTIARRMIVDDSRHRTYVRLSMQEYTQRMSEERFWKDSETVECRQIAEMERNAIGRLPEKMARVYAMTRFEGKTAQELAAELSISKRTVEYHLLMSRKEVRRMLKKAINQ